MDISNQYLRPLICCCELSNNYVAKRCSGIYIMYIASVVQTPYCTSYTLYILQVMDFQRRAIKVLDSFHMKQLSVPKRIK